jgi:hypothetical protein
MIGIDIALAEAAASVGRDRLATATDQVFVDTAALRAVVASKPNNQLCHVKGLAGEGLLTLDFNREAARRGSGLRAEWTHLSDCHAPADIRITRADAVVREAQVKTDQSKYVYSKLLHHRYEGMDRIVTQEQLDEVRQFGQSRLDLMETAARRDAFDHLTDELAYEDIHSGPLTNKRAEEAAKNPRGVTNGLRATECAREIGGAAGKGAAAGAASAAVFSGVGNFRAARRGDIGALEAVVDTGKAAAKAGACSGATAGAGAAIAIGARRVGAQRFAKGGGPTAVAACSFEVGAIVRRHLRGDIDATQMQREICTASARAGAAYYGGIVGQAVIPVPIVGALVGSVVASVIAETVLAGIAAELAARKALHEERLRLEAIASAAADLQARQRAELDQLAAAHAEELGLIRSAIAELGETLDDEPALALSALADLRSLTGGPDVLSAEAFDAALEGGMLEL